MPVAERKSGMPLSVETPAPGRTTAGARSRRSSARRATPMRRMVDLADPMDGFRFSTDLSVRFSETDAQGVVHNANYLIWFEIGRIDYLARFRGGYPELQAQGI